MSYTIRYGPEQPDTTKQRQSWLGVIGAIIIMGVCLLAISWYLPQQMHQLREALLPWTRNDVQMAFNELREHVSQGQPFGDAVTAFLRDIIHESGQMQ